MPKSSQVIIGWREWASLPDWNLELRAKADTGARSSAIDCTKIEELPGERVRFVVRISKNSKRKITLEEPIAKRKKVRKQQWSNPGSTFC